MEVIGTTEVVVGDGQGGSCGFWKWLGVEVVFEDGLDAFVGSGADGKRTVAGGFETFFGVSFSQSQDTEAGAEALLGVAARGEDVGDQLSGVWAGLAGPIDEAFRSLSTTLRHSPLQFTVQDLLSLDWVG